MAIKDKAQRAAYDAQPHVRRADYERHRQRYEEDRASALKRYGGQCACCGEDEPIFLVIDHIEGGGSRHHKKIGFNIVGWLRRNGYPEGFRVLCMNCNWSFYKLGRCIHKRSVLDNP